MFMSIFTSSIISLITQFATIEAVTAVFIGFPFAWILREWHEATFTFIFLHNILDNYNNIILQTKSYK